MFLVMGVTGKVGGAAAKSLLAAGKKVRALVRDRAKAGSWADQGVELVDGNWEDAASIEKAFQGVEGAYLMMPPTQVHSRDFSESKAVVANYVQALRQVSPKRVVALSSIGSEKTSGLGLITSTHLLEEGLKEFPGDLALVRAGGFYENFLYGLQAGQGGTLPVMYAPMDRPVPMIASADIGAEVAKLLTSEWSGRRIVELGTPITPDALASQLGEVLGREVKAQAVPRQAWTPTLEHMGLPQGSTWAYEEMIDSFNSGWIHFGLPGTEPVAGTTSARQVFAEKKAAAGASA